MSLEELSAWLNRQLQDHPEWRRLPVVSVELWLPKALEIKASLSEGHASIEQVDGYQEL